MEPRFRFDHLLHNLFDLVRGFWSLPHHEIHRGLKLLGLLVSRVFATLRREEVQTRPPSANQVLVIVYFRNYLRTAVFGTEIFDKEFLGSLLHFESIRRAEICRVVELRNVCHNSNILAGFFVFYQQFTTIFLLVFVFRLQH